MLGWGVWMWDVVGVLEYEKVTSAGALDLNDIIQSKTDMNSLVYGSPFRTDPPDLEITVRSFLSY